MPVVGIDLGTTYSEVAVLDEMKKPVVVPNAEANNTTPSVVFFEDEINIVVGEHAKNSSEAYPERVVQFVKNHIGFAGEGHTWKFFGETYGPEKISAIILRKLKNDAEASLGKSITGAVITVKQCEKLGEGVIKDIPAGLPAGSPMEVTFELTDESLIHVTAIETTHGTSVNFEVKREAGRSPAELKQAAQEVACKTVA